ncbi:MAG: ankyrin repeat domain-containing protein [Rickettsiaceae bacterium]|nr:ankyrin repeat domain-containing protein [Rickettsiaceae bacterium]
MNATNTNEDSQQKKSEVELIIVSPTIDNEKSSIKPKFEHKEFKPRLGLVIPESFDRLDKRLEKAPEDETLIQIYQKLSPLAISQKISTELCSKIMDRDLENLKNYLELTKKLRIHKLIEQDELDVILSTCLSFSAESGSIKILEELMSFISQFRKSDQEYILKAYPLALKVAVKNGHTDFIKELTDYFSQIVSDDRSFFERAKTEAIIKVKSLYDPPKNREEVLKTLESLKYEPHQQQDVIIDVTEALITTAPEPVLSIREALQTSPPTDLSNPQESTVDQIGDLEGSSMYVY